MTERAEPPAVPPWRVRAAFWFLGRQPSPVYRPWFERFIRSPWWLPSFALFNLTTGIIVTAIMGLLTSIRNPAQAFAAIIFGVLAGSLLAAPWRRRGELKRINRPDDLIATH